MRITGTEPVAMLYEQLEPVPIVTDGLIYNLAVRSGLNWSGHICCYVNTPVQFGLSRQKIRSRPKGRRYPSRFPILDWRTQREIFEKFLFEFLALKGQEHHPYIIGRVITFKICGHQLFRLAKRDN